MKKIYMFGLVSLLLMPLIITGCGAEKEASNSAPTAKTIEITLDDFSAENDRLDYIQIGFPGTLTVKLGANHTTGYAWEVTEIVHPEVIGESSNVYEGPTATDIVGAGGTEVWVFNTKDFGLAMIRMSYSQPWAGGEKDVYTVTINVNVKVEVEPNN